MILITGALASGKRTFAASLGYNAEDIAFDVQDDVREHLDSRAYLDALLCRLAEKPVVCCTEIGSGIIPLAAEDRLWREETGRLTCELAQRADAVVRMVCGIPQVLKGDPWSC